MSLLWGGLLLMVLAVVLVFIAFSSTEYGEQEQQFAAFVVAGLFIQLGMILLAAAGVVAGLGQRESAEPTT